MTTKIDADKYPNVARVCDALDMQVRGDLDCWQRGNHPPVVAYGIGQNPDYDAGIWGGDVSPWFDSMTELEVWAAKVSALETDDQIEAFIAGGWEKVT